MFSCYVMLGHSPKHIVLIPEVQLPFFIKHLQNQFFHCLCWRNAAHLGCYRHMVDQWNSVTPLVGLCIEPPKRDKQNGHGTTRGLKLHWEPFQPRSSLAHGPVGVQIRSSDEEFNQELLAYADLKGLQSFRYLLYFLLE